MASSVGRRSIGGLGSSRYAPSNASTEPELELEKDVSGQSSANGMGSPPTPPMRSIDSEGPAIVSIRRAETSLFPQLAKQQADRKKELFAFTEEDSSGTPERSPVSTPVPSIAPSIAPSITASQISKEDGPVRPPVLQRSKTSLRWNNRTVVIHLPLDTRHVDHSKPMPLTRKEVEERYAMFGEKPGVWTPKAGDPERMSRDLFPADSDRYIPTKEARPQVAIPDKRKWEAYVNNLREEKLKALGVDLGDILGPSTSPTPSAGRNSIPPELQQRTSSSPHPMLPFSNTFSPPPQPTSAGANHPHFSHQRHFSQSPMMASPIGSAASPFKPFHLQRQSMSISRTPPMYAPPPGFQHLEQPQPQNWEPYNSRQSPQPQPTPPMYGQPPIQPAWSPQIDMRGNSPGAFNSMNGNFSPQPQFSDLNGMPQPDYSMGGHDPRPMFGRHQHRPSVQWQNLHQQAALHQHQQQLQQQAQIAQQQAALQQQQQPTRSRLADLVEAEEPEDSISDAQKKEQERVTPIVVPVPKHGMNRLSVHLRQEMQGGKEEEDEEEVIKREATVPEAEKEEDSPKPVDEVVEPVVEAPAKPSVPEKVLTPVETTVMTPEPEAEAEAQLKPDLEVAVPLPVGEQSEEEPEPEAELEPDVEIKPVESEFETNPASPVLEEAEVQFPSQPSLPDVTDDIPRGAELEDEAEDSGNDTDPTKPSSKYHTRENSTMSNISSRLPPFLRQTPIHSRHNSQLQRGEPELPNTRNHASIPMLPAAHNLAVQNPMNGGFRDDLSEGAQTNISDIHTNPSEPPSPRRRFSGMGESKWIPDVPQHERNLSNSFSPPSQSKLNVEAPEFKFGGSMGGFNFTSDVFSPTQATPIKPPALPSHSRTNSGTQFNAAAPVFQPSNFTPESIKVNNFSLPSTVSKNNDSPFSFFSKGFNPSVPAFTPSRPPATLSSANSTPIFSYRHEDFISPPGPKKIPVVNADDESDEEIGWASGGRPSFLRDNRGGKKSRFNDKDDGDDVPQFAPVPLMDEMEAAKDMSDRETSETPVSPSADEESAESIESANEQSVDDPEARIVMESYVGNPEETRREVDKEDRYIFKVSSEATSFAEARPMGVNDVFVVPSNAEPFRTDSGFHESEDSAVEEEVMEREKSEVVPEKREITFDPEAAEFKFTGGLDVDESTEKLEAPDLAAVPMAERMSTPSAQELNDTFNFMFTNENGSKDEDEDEELQPEDEDDEGLEQEVALEPPVEPAAVSSSSEGIQPAPALPEYISPSEKAKLALQAERKIERSGAPSPSPIKVATTILQTPQERGIPTIDTLEPDSDWDSLLPENDTQESKLKSRAPFFDTQVESVVGTIMEKRLDPLEKSLTAIHTVLQDFTPLRKRLIRRQSILSDADDEDDDEEGIARSPTKKKEDKKLERIRTAVMDALISRDLATIKPEPQPTTSMDEIKAMMAGFLEAQKEKDSREAERSIKKEEEDDSAATIEMLQLRISALEKSLEDTRKVHEEEVSVKRTLQDTIFDLERRLKASHEKEVEHKERADENERKLREAEEKRNRAVTQAQMRTALLEGAHASLQKSVGDLTVQKATLEGQLTEAKHRADRILSDMEAAVNEASELRRSIPILEASLEESRRLHDGSNSRLEDLQEKVIKAAAEIENKQARWRERNEAQKNRIQTLENRLETEVRMRESMDKEMRRLEAEEKAAIRYRIELDHVVKMKDKLEIEMARLQTEEREAIRLRIESDQVRIHSQKMEALADRLRMEVIEKERQVIAEREAKNQEILRLTMGLQGQVETARVESETVRATLEAEMSKIMMEAETAKERLKMLHDEAIDAKDAFIREMKTSHDVAMQQETNIYTAKMEQQHQQYELTIESLKEQHDRSLGNALEDSERETSFLKEQMEVLQGQQSLYVEKIELLENQLGIAKQAAQAAAQAAQTAKVPTVENKAVPSAIEKPSTQALRESIAVLQDQLQAREATIEKLEEQLANPGNTPAAKEVEHENVFLRELLSVRIGELDEIVRQLTKPQFDKVAVRNAAIRLKANLEMEQQERERNAALTASTEQAPASTVGSLYGIANRGLSGALGGLRKGKARYDDPGYVSIASQQRSSSAMSREISDQGSVQQTPSRPTSRQNFLTGLLTPPISLSKPTAFVTSTLAQDRFASLTRGGESSTARQGPSSHPGRNEKNGSFVYDDDANESVSGMHQPYFEDSIMGDDGRDSAVPNVQNITDDEDDDVGVPGFARRSPYMRS
ncbi:hypothetical protein ABW19_dt0208552 [Dactylella cylindrospora]|nr:hypothetical protein ABW19_dt0208552 [Dactylella cylindrospora]